MSGPGEAEVGRRGVRGVVNSRLMLLCLAIVWAGRSSWGVAEPVVSGVAVDAASGEKHGYWWKKEVPPPEDTDQAAGDLPPPPSEEALLKLHPKEVAKLLDDYRDNALFTMKPEQVTWYYYLQDFARRRARAFMNVSQFVMLQNPTLNMNTVYSDSPPGQEARRAEYERSINDRLEQERGTAGLILLVRKGCDYCEAQRTALKFFNQRHQWDITEEDIGDQPQIAAQFGVDYTPTTIVVLRNSDKWQPVSVGVDTVPAIEENLYNALRLLHGETSPERYNLQEYQDGGPYDPSRGR